MKRKNILPNMMLFLCIIIFLYCGYRIVSDFLEKKEAKDEYTALAKEIRGKRQINWQKLLSINKDTVGWVYAKGTDIDYPIVQGKNNSEYLHKTFKGTYNASGSIFLDAKGNNEFLSDNNVIYGHHMRNGTMFADLLKFREQSFIKKHDKIVIYTPTKTIHLQVISAYARSAKCKIPITFDKENTLLAYKEDILSRSEIKTKATNEQIKEANRIYTFVTCSYEADNYRTFVHAIEVK